MRRVGMSEGEILAAIRKANLDRCTPPLEDKELAGIAERVARYEPDQVSVAIAENHYGQIFEGGEAKEGPVIVCMNDIEPRQIDWLWEKPNCSRPDNSACRYAGIRQELSNL